MSQPPVKRLDDEHVLEPVRDDAVDHPSAEPVVRDARGGLWRVRRLRRGGETDWWATGSLVVLVVLAVLLAVAALSL